MKEIIFGLTVFLTSFAQAGVESSGGGPSVVCEGPNHTVATAQFYDLFEGRSTAGLNIPQLDEAAEGQLKAALQKLAGINHALAVDAYRELNYVQSKMVILPVSILIGPVSDLGTAPLFPAGCQLSYVGFWERNGTLRVSKSVFDVLSQTDRAAFFMHEALYRLARRNSKQVDSYSTRVATAFLFSTENSPSEEVVASMNSLVPEHTNVHTPVVRFTPEQSQFTLRLNCEVEQESKEFVVGIKYLGRAQSADPVRSHLGANKQGEQVVEQKFIFDNERKIVSIWLNWPNDTSRCKSASLTILQNGNPIASIPFGTEVVYLRTAPEINL